MENGVVRAAIAAIACVCMLTTGCDDQIGDYLPVSSISTASGFARDRKQALRLSGKQVKVWGYVDYSNVYADGAGGAVPAHWDDAHSHNGERRDMWRFDLMARPRGEAGSGFAVYLPKQEAGRKLFAVFAAGERREKPTRVFVKGRIFTFDAPTNFALLTGLCMEVKSVEDVLLEHPDAE